MIYRLSIHYYRYSLLWLRWEKYCSPFHLKILVPPPLNRGLACRPPINSSECKKINSRSGNKKGAGGCMIRTFPFDKGDCDLCQWWDGVEYVKIRFLRQDNCRSGVVSSRPPAIWHNCRCAFPYWRFMILCQHATIIICWVLDEKGNLKVCWRHECNLTMSWCRQ